MSDTIQPFPIHMPQADLDDLADRLARTRWPDAGTVQDGAQGPQLDRIRALVHAHAPAATVTGRVSGEAFLTPPGALSTLVADAIRAETGLDAELSTTGGTSDARFLSRLCPTVEFGLVNATMHKVDEAVAVADLRALTDIYARIIARTSADG